MKAVVVLGAILCLATAQASAEDAKNLEWPRYGHDLANTRFQNIDQIKLAALKRPLVAAVGDRL